MTTACVCASPAVHAELYDAWLSGLTVAEALETLRPFPFATDAHPLAKQTLGTQTMETQSMETQSMGAQKMEKETLGTLKMETQTMGTHKMGTQTHIEKTLSTVTLNEQRQNQQTQNQQTLVTRTAVVQSQYVLFDALAALFLRRPAYFCAQETHLRIANRAALTRRFFALDPAVACALAARRLAPRTRRDIADVADELRTRPAVVARHFENMCLAQARLGDAFSAAATQQRPPEEAAAVAAFAVRALQTALAVPCGLAREYAAALFLNHHAFALPPGVSAQKALACAAVMLCHWTAGTLSFTLDARIPQASRAALDALESTAGSVALASALSLGASLSTPRGVSNVLYEISQRLPVLSTPTKERPDFNRTPAKERPDSNRTPAKERLESNRTPAKERPDFNRTPTKERPESSTDKNIARPKSQLLLSAESLLPARLSGDPSLRALLAAVSLCVQCLSS